MHIHFLGTGAAFNSQLGNTAAFYRENDRLLLLDCGETVFSQMLSRNLLDGIRSVYVAISHTHGDHVGSLSSLIFYCWYVLHIRLDLIVPNEQDGTYAAHLCALLTAFGVDETMYTIIPSGPIPDFQGFSAFLYLKTTHTPMLDCYSFQIETDAGGIFYSADTNTTAQLAEFLETHNNPEAIYMESTDLDFPGNIHLPLHDLAQILPGHLRDRTCLMHLNSPACARLGMAMGFRIATVE